MSFAARNGRSGTNSRSDRRPSGQSVRPRRVEPRAAVRSLQWDDPRQPCRVTGTPFSRPRQKTRTGSTAQQMKSYRTPHDYIISSPRVELRSPNSSHFQRADLLTRRGVAVAPFAEGHAETLLEIGAACGRALPAAAVDDGTELACDSTGRMNRQRFQRELFVTTALAPSPTLSVG